MVSELQNDNDVENEFQKKIEIDDDDNDKFTLIDSNQEKKEEKKELRSMMAFSKKNSSGLSEETSNGKKLSIDVDKDSNENKRRKLSYPQVVECQSKDHDVQCQSHTVAIGTDQDSTQHQIGVLPSDTKQHQNNRLELMSMNHFEVTGNTGIAHSSSCCGDNPESKWIAYLSDDEFQFSSSEP